MAPERGTRAVLAALVLVVLAAPDDAQGRGARGRGRSAKPEYAPWGQESGKDGKGKGAGKAEKVPEEHLPGFDSPRKGAKDAAAAAKRGKGRQKGAKAPAGADPKKQDPKKQKEKEPAPKPLDPMKEADEVTAAAEQAAALEEARARLVLEHFRVCDLDGNGWLSLREAEVTLSLDRAEYQRADGDRDGRLDPAEFDGQQALLLARLGAQPAAVEAETAAQPAEPLAQPPLTAAPATPAIPDDAPAVPPPGTRAATLRSGRDALAVKPGEMEKRYDSDGSKGLDAVELQKLVTEVGISLSPELAVAKMDKDGSGQLESVELFAIAWMVSGNLPESLRPAAGPAPAGSAPAEPSPPTPSPSELQETAAGAVASEPPAQGEARGVAGLTHFGRLDANRDAYLDEADLRKLQYPARLDVRLTAVLSAMDRDGDGRLSEDEFRASMRDLPR